MRSKKEAQKGAVAAEFILTLPFFFILTFMIMEVSLMWVDKHFLRLAGFEAARALVTSAAENPCEDETLLRDARAAASLRMAAVAPSVAEIFRTTKLEIDWQGFEGNAASQLGRAVTHVLERLPAATVLTEVECSYYAETELVDVSMTFWRTAKMPLVKHIIWGLYAIRHLGDDHFKMEPTYYDIELKNPIAKPASDVRSALNHWQGDVKGAAALVEASGWGQDTFGWAARWNQELDEGMSTAEQKIDNQLEATSKVVTAVVYAMPEPLRLVPIRLNVALRRNYFKRKGQEWEKGQAVAVAPFTTGGTDSPWYQWVKKMQEHPPNW